MASSMRRCDGCHRRNPPGFLYCGYCANPLENTELRKRLLERAAPPGGWPSLGAELVEVKFFLQQGQLADAYELLSLLRDRHPGHPALQDFTRSNPVVADPRVGELVEQILANSAQLASKMPRRAAPEWKAPRAFRNDAKHTRAHEVVRTNHPGGADTQPTPLAAPAKPIPKPLPTPILEDEVTKPRGTAAAARERTRVYRSTDPPRHPSRSGDTTAVTALQPPSPWSAEPDAEVDVSVEQPAIEHQRAKVLTHAPDLQRRRHPAVSPSADPPESTDARPDPSKVATKPLEPAKVSKKRGKNKKNKKNKKKRVAAPAAADAADGEPRRTRGVGFGAHVLSRLGGKSDKDGQPAL
jgi:hypothetical protein